MTSITSSSAAFSPADRMQIALQRAVSAGTVKATDQSALSSALTSIQSSLQASAPPTPGTDPTSIKSKVDGLIDGQVSSGTLTSDQATELKQVFAQAAGKMGGHHHPHMPDASGETAAASSSNPLDSLFSTISNAIDSVLGTSATNAASSVAASSDATAASGTSAASTTNSTSATAGLTSSIDQLVGFLKQVEQQIAGHYTATGSTAGSVTSDPLLVDATA